MKPFTFDQIPAMMNKLFKKLEHLENLIERLPQTVESKNELLNVEQASKFLNLSVSTMYSKVCKIPFNKQGKRIYFYKDELKIKSGRVTTYDEMKDKIEKGQKSRLQV